MTSPTIVAVVTDLLFQSRLREQAQALDYEVTVTETLDAIRDALAGSPALVVLDLHVTGLDWQEAVATAKERGVPVLAFGRHTEAQLLRSAREAGCDRVVPRSTFVEELPRLIAGLAV